MSKIYRSRPPAPVLLMKIAKETFLLYPLGLKWLIAVALSLSCFASTVFSPVQAYASSSIHLSVGSQIYYDSYSTANMSADGVVAYCAQPAKMTPPSGNYATAPAVPSSPARTNELRAHIWFGYGGPGFDPSMWPTVYYDGSAWTNAKYQAVTHILLSDTYQSDAHSALTGCSALFKSWAANEIIGFDINTGSLTNNNAVGRKMAARQGEVPQGFKAWQIGTGSTTQIVVTHEAGGYIELQKAGAQENLTMNNASYSLEGAVYGVYSESSCATQVATLTTNIDGYAKVFSCAGSFFVKEITAPPGHALDSTVYPVTVLPGKTTRVNNSAGGQVYDTPQHNPLSLSLSKVDSETDLSKGQGSASLAGAEYTISYYNTLQSTSDTSWVTTTTPTRTWALETNEQGEAEFSESFVVSGDDLYYSASGAPTLPLGTIAIRETKAPEGYLLDEALISVQQITSEGTGEHLEIYKAPIHPEQVKRGDLQLVKVADSSLQRMGLIPFALTAQSTGETHIFITDENGFASTSSDWSPHSSNTNRGETPQDGIWFGELEALDDNKGALYYDTYTIEELPCENNLDRALTPPFDITISRDSYTVNLGTLTNDGLVLTSFASDEDGQNKFFRIGDTATVMDTVSYTNLCVGMEYTLHGTLMDKASEELLLIDNEPVIAQTTFIPEEKDGAVPVSFSFETASLEQDTQLVVFERLYREDDPFDEEAEIQAKPVAVHEDIEDENQTVTFYQVEEPPEETPELTGYDKTGNDGERWIGYLLTAAVFLGGLVLAYGIKQRKAHKKQAWKNLYLD